MTEPLIPGIYGFSGNHRFLSNFEPTPVVFEGFEYPSVEHAYQAAKTNDLYMRTSISGMTAGQAKRAGRIVKMREEWEDIKTAVMYSLLKEKFSNNPLKQKLLETKGFYIEETNTWNDTFWGVCNGKGQNILGLLLMKVRDEIENEGS